jgi:two-component system, chemotaxis family, chemotaxis protein CheY
MARILIVDDSILMRTALADILTAGGHTIVGEAASAKEAVEKYNALQPDLMTSDVVMPVEAGIDTQDAVGQIIEQNPQAKILMVSSIGQPYVITEMIKAGARDFIIKPFDPALVIKTVNRILGAS